MKGLYSRYTCMAVYGQRLTKVIYQLNNQSFFFAHRFYFCVSIKSSWICEAPQPHRYIVADTDNTFRLVENRERNLVRSFLF